MCSMVICVCVVVVVIVVVAGSGSLSSLRSLRSTDTKVKHGEAV